MIENVGDGERSTKPITRLSVFYYGVGHMLNDITSACWFTYLLVFLTEIGLPSRDAAIVMLSGQIADGFTTIFAGELIDRFGHFKIWHGAGSLLVAVSFSSVFGGCLPCKILGSTSSTLRTVGYGTFASIFNVGWAATQVSHMSMVNCITVNSTSRVVLTSCRNAFTMVANLGLYAIAFLVFSVNRSGKTVDVEKQYRWIAYLSIAIGCFFVVIFHFGTDEPRLKQYVEGKGYASISWSYWFKKVLYYQVAVVYMVTRLVTNISQAFLAFYVISDLQMSQSSKALVPAIIYICSFVVSVLLQVSYQDCLEMLETSIISPFTFFVHHNYLVFFCFNEEMNWSGQRVKAFYSAGGLLWLLCGTGILFLPQRLNALMYILSIVIGIANALIMVTGVSMQSFLVGEDVNGCAFVYGSLSFLDKISCGLALYIIESYQNLGPVIHANSSTHYNISGSRFGLGFVPAICALIGVTVTCSTNLHNPGTSMPLEEPLLA